MFTRTPTLYCSEAHKHIANTLEKHLVDTLDGNIRYTCMRTAMMKVLVFKLML